MIPIPLSWGGRQLWGVNQKKRRRPPPIQNSASLPNVPLLDCALVHYSQPQCQDLQLLTLLHKTTDTSSIHPPAYVFVSFTIYHRCPECWEARWEIGYWTFAPAPLLPNFGGNGNFHILAEIENIKSENRLVEYCSYAEKSDAILQMVTLKWLTLDISNRTCAHIV